MADNVPTLKQRDYTNAAKLNRAAILQKVGNYSTPVLNDFLKHNHAALKPLLKRDVPLFYEEGKKTDEEVKAIYKQIRTALTKMSDGVVGKIDFKQLNIEEVKPEEFAQKRLEREIKRATEIKNSNAALKRSGKYLGLSLYKTAAAPVLLTAGIFSGFLNAVKASANAVEAFYDRAGVSKLKRASITGAAWMGTIMFGMGETSAAPFIPHNPNLGSAFHEACEPGTPYGPVKDAVYARTFNGRAATSVAQKHAFNTMRSGAKNGVPAIALHLISYLETGKFSDMQANNSSAAGPFQIIRSTLALYIKDYGQQTEIYQSAKQRVKAGTATDPEKSIVDSFDEVAKMPLSKLKSDIALKNYIGPIHDALAHATLSAVSAQLVALDLANNFPEIKNPNLNLDQVLDVMTKYYARNHFLGMGNHNTLIRMAKNNPTLPITDFKKVSAAVGISTANNLKEITDGNPAFSKKNMTAGQFLDEISRKFREYVAEPMDQFKKQSAIYKTSMDACLINGTKNPYPETITRFEAMGHAIGLTSLQEKFKPEVAKAEPAKTKTQPAPASQQQKPVTAPLPPPRPKSTGPGTNV